MLSVFSKIIKYISPAWIRLLVTSLAILKARNLTAEDGLRLLFGIESDIYPIEGRLAVEYGNGIHTKHRHINYHDFFVNRIYHGERVLDVGCGIGAVAFDIAQKSGAEVTGIDLSEKNILVAREKYSHRSVKYVVGDVLEELPDDEFDVIILSNVLEHLTNRPSFLRKLLLVTHARRVLIRVPLFERDWRVPLKKELGVEWRLDPTHEIEYTLHSFSEEMSAAGLIVNYQDICWGEIWAETTREQI